MLATFNVLADRFVELGGLHKVLPPPLQTCKHLVLASSENSELIRCTAPQEGIFRIPGRSHLLGILHEQLKSRPLDAATARRVAGGCGDVHTMGGLLQRWLKNLQPSVVPEFCHRIWDASAAAQPSSWDRGAASSRRIDRWRPAEISRPAPATACQPSSQMLNHCTRSFAMHSCSIDAPVGMGTARAAAAAALNF